MAAAGWNDVRRWHLRRRRAVISGHLNEKSRLAGRRMRPARPDSGTPGRPVRAGSIAQGTLQATARGPGAHGTPVLSVSGDQKLIQNADLPGARAADKFAASCLFAELELQGQQAGPGGM